jgi:tripartite-type tricarboxylate transporter receptor subunit TctC
MATMLLAYAHGRETQAAEYPAKPVRVVVGSSAGGGGDILARTVIQRLNESLGQPIVIDNRGGAGGAIACEIVAKAQPDGYTVLIASVGMLAINPVLYPKLQYAPLRDFAPVTLVAESPYVLVVHPSVAARSVKDLVGLARAKPGRMNFASGGAGTGNHFSGELFKLAAGIDLVHVPYKGTGPALADVVSGQVEIMFSNLLAAMPPVKAGRLRALAVTTAQRSQSTPDLPTVAESGYPGFETTTWHAVLLPAATPKPIVNRLNSDLVKIVREKDMKERLASQGTETVGSTPEQLFAHIRSETAKWGQVVKQARIKAD